MARYYGEIGFSTTIETSPGVWKDDEVEKRFYYGDVIRNRKRVDSSNKVNNDIVVSNEISIIADPYVIENFHKIIYIEFMGIKWTINDIDINYPRLRLTLGGVYNGE